LFWSLMTAGMAMWCCNQSFWVWFEVMLRRTLPNPFLGDMVLFLHIVPIMAAVAIRPIAERCVKDVAEPAQCHDPAGLVDHGLRLLRFSRRVHRL